MENYKCKKCGKNFETAVNFCSACGGNVASVSEAENAGMTVTAEAVKEIKCQKCGKVYTSPVYFCDRCGTAIETSSETIDFVCIKCRHRYFEKVAFCPDCGGRTVSYDMALRNDIQYGQRYRKYSIINIMVSALLILLFLSAVLFEEVDLLDVKVDLFAVFALLSIIYYTHMDLFIAIKWFYLFLSNQKSHFLVRKATKRWRLLNLLYPDIVLGIFIVCGWCSWNSIENVAAVLLVTHAIWILLQSMILMIISRDRKYLNIKNMGRNVEE